MSNKAAKQFSSTDLSHLATSSAVQEELSKAESRHVQLVEDAEEATKALREANDKLSEAKQAARMNGQYLNARAFSSLEQQRSDAVSEYQRIQKNLSRSKQAVRDLVARRNTLEHGNPFHRVDHEDFHGHFFKLARAMLPFDVFDTIAVAADATTKNHANRDSLTGHVLTAVGGQFVRTKR